MPRPSAPEPRKQFGLRLRIRLIRELRHVAVDQEKNLNDMVEEAVEDLLKKYREKKKPSG
jgi:predicted HicB family RNase H-like nuclease